MMHVMRASELIGLPVVSIAIGEDIAEIRDVVYDGEAHRLIGFTLNKRGIFAGRMSDVLPCEGISSIGADAVMVIDETAITDSASPSTLERSGQARSVIGNRVMSADGRVLGEVVEVIIATGTNAAAVGYEITPTDGSGQAFMPISAQMALSDENLIVPTEATQFIRNDLAGFGAAVTDFRKSNLERGTT